MTDQNATTVIGPGTHVTGEVKSKGTVRIEGHVSGRVECDDTIVIHESGSVEADLEANQIVISGNVQGNTFAHERLEVTSSGKIMGDITSPRLSIAEGVMFEGTCTMKSPNEVRQQVKPEAKNIEKLNPKGGEQLRPGKAASSA